MTCKPIFLPVIGFLRARYTKFEYKHMGHSAWKGEEGMHDKCELPKLSHHITIATGPVKEVRPRVDVFITLTGSGGRSTPVRLIHRLDECNQKNEKEGIEEYEIKTEPIGDLLAVIGRENCNWKANQSFIVCNDVICNITTINLCH